MSVCLPRAVKLVCKLPPQYVAVLTKSSHMTDTAALLHVDADDTLSTQLACRQVTDITGEVFDSGDIIAVVIASCGLVYEDTVSRISL